MRAPQAGEVRDHCAMSAPNSEPPTEGLRIAFALSDAADASCAAALHAFDVVRAPAQASSPANNRRSQWGDCYLRCDCASAPLRVSRSASRSLKGEHGFWEVGAPQMPEGR